MEQMGQVPREGDSFTWEKLKQVKTMAGNRVEKVQIEIYLSLWNI